MDKIQPGTLPARIIETRGPVQYADVTAGEPYRAGHPYARALVELGGIRAVLAVPLLKDGVAVGMVAIYRQEVGAFSDKQIVLLQNFAAQAVIAMENARLLTEQREALEQQTATAEVLQVINASPGNLTPVFDAMLEKAMRLCEAAFGSLYTYDGERFHSAAQRGVPPAYAAFRAENPPCRRRVAAPRTLLETRTTSPGARSEGTRDPTRPAILASSAMVELGGIRTILMRATSSRTKLCSATSSIYRQEVRAFSDKQIALLENFAAQAVIAMENARLITETARGAGAADRDRRGVAGDQRFARQSHAGVRCDTGEGARSVRHRLWRLATYDGERLHSVAQRGLSAAFADRLRQGYRASDSPASRPLLAGGRFTHITDVAAVDYHGISGVRSELAGIRTVLFVPLRKDGCAAGDDCVCAQGGASVHREGNFAAGELRRPGGDRDGECAADR